MFLSDQYAFLQPPTASTIPQKSERIVVGSSTVFWLNIRHMDKRLLIRKLTLGKKFILSHVTGLGHGQ
jgi:hypothetical protein